MEVGHYTWVRVKVEHFAMRDFRDCKHKKKVFAFHKKRGIS